MKIGMLVLLVAGVANARPAEDPLGQLLRASFGVGETADLRDVMCTPTKCTATDHLDNDRALTGTSAELRDQLKKVAPILSIWRIDCGHGKCNLQINADDDILAAELMSMGGAKI